MGGGHSQFGVKVTELLVDPDIAVPALYPGLGPLILAAKTLGLPVMGCRGDLLVLQDDGWARARERHGRSGRTEGQGMEGRTTPRRFPWSLPRTPLPLPTRQLLQGHAALPVQSPELAVGLEAAGPSPDKGPAVQPPSRGSNSRRWRRWQEPIPSPALGSDGSVPGSRRGARERARVQLQLLLFGPSRAYNPAASPPGSATRAKDKGCSPPGCAPNTGSPAVLTVSPAEVGAWGLGSRWERGQPLQSHLSVPPSLQHSPRVSPGQQGQLFFPGLSFLQSNCLCYVLTPCAVTSEHSECLLCARSVFCRPSGYVRGARLTQHREPACGREPPVFPTRFTQVIVRCSPGSRSRGWMGNHVAPTGAGCTAGRLVPHIPSQPTHVQHRADMSYSSKRTRGNLRPNQHHCSIFVSRPFVTFKPFLALNNVTLRNANNSLDCDCNHKKTFI